MKKFRVAVPAILPLVLFAGVVLALLATNGSSHGKPAANHSEADYTPPSAKTEMWYNGVAIPTLDDLATWKRATGEHPGIVQVYVALGTAFPLGELETIERSGAMPVIQIDYKQPFSNIMAGDYDKIMRRWGADIRRMDEPIALSFGHEMNGNWYPWGCTHVEPSSFISVWRRMHDLMASSKVLWLYTINSSNAGFSCSPMEYYPGNAYVNWIGIDGYLRNAQENFSTVFLPTISQVRAQSAKPILITEVGVPSNESQPSQIQALYTDAHQSGSVIGIVYFDQSTAKGDYRPQDNPDPAALKAFRKEVSLYGNAHALR